MFVRFLPAVLLLSCVVKGTSFPGGPTTDTSTTPTVSDTSVTMSSITSSTFPTSQPSTTEHHTTSAGTTRRESSTTTTNPSTSTAETTLSQSSTVAERTGSPSAPPTTTSPGTSQATTTMTSSTTLTAPTETATGNTTSFTTTISTGPTNTGTTLPPTPTSTNNATTITTGTSITGTTLPSPSTTIHSTTNTPGTTITGTTLSSPSTTNHSTTITLGTTTTATTLLPTPTTITNSTTISTGSTMSGTTLPPTLTTTNNPSTTVCPAKPCPLESVCLNGTCQCLSGSVLVNDVCRPAQVFPGQLHLNNLTFQPEMSDRSSAIFQRQAAEISAALRDVLKDQPGYLRSEVLRLQQGSVLATVNNVYENTNVTQATVDQAISEAIANQVNPLFANAEFTGTDLCAQEPLPCDFSTTTCTPKNGQPACVCKEGFVPISNLYSNSSCRACPSGQRAVGDMCQPCAFGYAGFNCNDSALLAVVVISCVLGGVLLIIVLALLAYYCWRKCSKTKSDISSSPYSSGDVNQPWPTGITPIPRANTNFVETPPIEMAEGGNTVPGDKKHQTNGFSGSYDLTPVGMNTFKGKNPSRYSYLVQGHENPYFLPGDDKKN